MCVSVLKYDTSFFSFLKNLFIKEIFTLINLIRKHNVR